MQSQIAQLRANIELELTAMHQGLYGLAAGVSRHQFVQARMSRLGSYGDQLATYIGAEQAIQYSFETYARIVEGGTPQE